MKKNVLFLLLASCLFLAACGNSSSKTAKNSSDKEKTTTQSAVTSTQTSSTTKVTEPAPVETIEAYQYEQTAESGEQQIIKETIVYKGDKFLKLEVHITNKATEETKASLSGMDFGTVKSQMLSYFNEDAAVQQLKAVPGVVMETDLSPEYDIIVNIKIDMTTVDLKALSAVEGMGADFTQFATLTPREYILGLKLQGAKEVAQ